MPEEKTKYHVDNRYLNDPQVFGDIVLLQIGRRYCEPGAIIGEHIHNNLFELTIVTGGAGVIVTDGVESRVESGDIYLSFPNESHDLRASEGVKFEYDFFSFSADSPYRDEYLSLMNAHVDPHARIIQDERISYIIALAIAEFSCGRSHRDEMMHSMMRQVLIYVLRDFKDGERATANVSSSDIFCQNMMSYIDTHIYSITSLREVADNFNYNYSYISNLFKNQTGNTLSEYYRNRRMDIAKSLICEGKKTIGEISEQLGYSTPFAFSAAFKKHFGVFPKAFKGKNGGCEKDDPNENKAR